MESLERAVTHVLFGPMHAVRDLHPCEVGFDLTRREF
jgi:hypothetical protein